MAGRSIFTEDTRSIVVGDLYEKGVPRLSPIRHRAENAGGEVEILLVALEDSVVCTFSETRPGGQVREGRHVIPLDWTSSSLGGRRAWFFCPSCERRIARLFLCGTRVLCRTCAGVRYRSQAVRTPKYLRRRERAREIRLVLGGRPDPPEPFPARPKGMHRTSYERLREEARAIEQADIEGAVERGEVTATQAFVLTLIHGLQYQRAGRTRPD